MNGRAAVPPGLSLAKGIPLPLRVWVGVGGRARGSLHILSRVLRCEFLSLLLAHPNSRVANHGSGTREAAGPAKPEPI
jgi:hypothetical protein